MSYVTVTQAYAAGPLWELSIFISAVNRSIIGWIKQLFKLVWCRTLLPNITKVIQDNGIVDCGIELFSSVTRCTHQRPPTLIVGMSFGKYRFTNGCGATNAQALFLRVPTFRNFFDEI